MKLRQQIAISPGAVLATSVGMVDQAGRWPMVPNGPKQRLADQLSRHPRGAVAQIRNRARPPPFPKRIYATATVRGQPSMLKRFKMAARTCSSATWPSKHRAVTLSPSRLKQPILVSIKLRR